MQVSCCPLDQSDLVSPVTPTLHKIALIRASGLSLVCHLSLELLHGTVLLVMHILHNFFYCKHATSVLTTDAWHNLDLRNM